MAWFLATTAIVMATSPTSSPSSPAQDGDELSTATTTTTAPIATTAVSLLWSDQSPRDQLRLRLEVFSATIQSNELDWSDK
jgi:hypothetical protein